MANEISHKRGSEWRKWDLHIHTPASFHWTGGRFFEMNQSEEDRVLQRMFDKINGSDVAVFAITDYWTFDGYIKFKNYIKRKGLTLNKTVFPGMELRVEAPVDYRLNIQVILSDELSEQQLKDFKSKLKIASIDRTLSDEALKDFAKSLDDGKAKKHGFASVSTLNDDELLQLGSMTAEITKESLCKKAFSAIPPKSGYVLMPFDTSNGLMELNWEEHPHDDNYFMQSADIFESRNDELIDLFLGKETDKNKLFIKNFIKTMGGKPKPAVSGSDAHKIENYGNYPNDRITWIKADTTFQGLTQIINEPLDRTYVGIMPTKLIEVESNKSKYLNSIKIKNTDPAASPSWFDNEFPLNNSLAVVIGRKGSGKSALADIISLCGNSKIKSDEYSFLKPQKFKKRGIAKSYEATITWIDGQKEKKNLEENAATTAVERIKYLPQQYVENICNEDGVSTLFQKEIDKVIFSYVPEESRLDTHSLAELIKIKTESVDSNISTACVELNRNNEYIVSLEDKESPKYIESLEENLKIKQQEIKNLVKPKTVKTPKSSLNKAEAIEIKKLTTSIEKINKLISTSRVESKSVNSKIQKLDTIASKIITLKGSFDEFIKLFEPEAKELSIDLSKIIEFKFSDSILTAKNEELIKEKNRLDNLLETNNPKSSISLYNKKYLLETSLANITESLSVEQKRYKEYLQNLKKYEEKIEIIKGNKKDTNIETIAGIESEINFVKTKLGNKIEEALKKRKIILKKIFGELENKITFYQDIYNPLVRFIKSEEENQKKTESSLNFNAGLVFSKQKFINEFFSFVNQRRDGSFQGLVDGQKILNGLIEKYDLTKQEDINSFLDDILDYLKNDKTKEKETNNFVKSQLKKDQKDFYNFLFGLNYLDVKYKILFNGKDLNTNEFSPGEKGALLLIFYLLIDKENIPLVIDQPEENLDNESIYTLLVPYIKRAKKRRQIIAITHNPNLAVVCDAEQVICATMNKKNNEIRYISGSIEEPIINKKIVDILEGTLPAFTVRDEKYIKNKN